MHRGPSESGWFARIGRFLGIMSRPADERVGAHGPTRWSARLWLTVVAGLLVVGAGVGALVAGISGSGGQQAATGTRGALPNNRLTHSQMFHRSASRRANWPSCRRRRRSPALLRLRSIWPPSRPPAASWYIPCPNRFSSPGLGGSRSRCCRLPNSAARPGFLWCRPARDGLRYCFRVGPTVPRGGFIPVEAADRGSKSGAVRMSSGFRLALASSAWIMAASRWERGRWPWGHRGRRHPPAGPSCSRRWHHRIPPTAR